MGAPERDGLERGQDVEVIARRRGVAWLFSYYPLVLEGRPLGVIEVSESLEAEAEAARATVLRTVLSTLIIATLTAFLTHFLGMWLVGRPVAQLMEKARRVGAGDLSGPIELTQRDELSDLAREMNAMCARLESESRARQHALEQLRHAERLATVGRLAAGVAHELGTPLNVVTLEAKRIAVGRAVAERAVEAATTIGAQAERMAEIIRQLLDFARRRAPRPSCEDLTGLVRKDLSVLGSLAARQNVRIELVEGAEVRVRVDPGQFGQVLTNLLVNGIQAMPNGGEVRVEVGRESVDDAPELAAFVRVIDAGVGIAEADLPRIFEPFYTTKDVGQGTGLGLAVAHGIVEEHGGRIEVESVLAEGARFTVRLPLAEAAEGDA